MARPTILSRPMTQAERAKAYRDRRKKAARTGVLAPLDPRVDAVTSTTALLDTLRTAFARRDRANCLRVLRLLAARAQEFEDQLDLLDDDDGES